MSWLTDGATKKQDDAYAGADETNKTHNTEKQNSNQKPSGKAPRKLAETPKPSSNQQNGNHEKKSANNPTETANSAHKVSEKTDDTKEGVDGATVE